MELIMGFSMSSLMQIHEIRLKNTRDLMKKSGLSRTDFAEKVGLSYNLLSQYIGKNPTKNIGDETALKIEEAFGKPKGFLDQASAVNISLDEASQSEKLTEMTPISNVRPSRRKLRKIPVLDFVQAGIWREVVYDGVHPKDETYTSYEGKDPNAVFSLEIDGLSMAPEFMPGDEIVVDAALDPKPGSLVVAQEIQHGVAMTTFKKYRVVGVNEHGVDIIELVPLNPDFPTYNSSQIEISIIGVVVQHHKDFKY